MKNLQSAEPKPDIKCAERPAGLGPIVQSPTFRLLFWKRQAKAWTLNFLSGAWRSLFNPARLLINPARLLIVQYGPELHESAFRFPPGSNWQPERRR